MTSETSTEIRRNIFQYITDRFFSHTESNGSNGTTQDPFHNISTELISNTSFNETTISHPEQKTCDTLYCSYPTDLVLAGAACYIILSIFGTTGNFISILALLKKKGLRNSTTAFIVNLCAADMLFCSFTMPVTAITLVERNWNYGIAMCKLFAMVMFSNAIVSIFTIVAITVNRYILIVHPRLYPKVYSKRKTAIYIICLWVLPLTLISLPLFDAWGTLIYNPDIGDCGVYDLHGKSPRTFIFVLIMVLPSVLFIACYTHIYFVVKKTGKKSHRKKNSRVSESCVTNTNEDIQINKPESKINTFRTYLRDRNDFRVLRIVLVLFIVYLLSTFPAVLIKLFRKEKDLPVLNILGYIMYFSSSVINPVIYIIMSREYRIAYKELFLSKLC